MESKSYLRKPTRNKNIDYSAPGAYFLTICTKDRKCTLSKIIFNDQKTVPLIYLTEYGKICEEQLGMLSCRFPSVIIDQYVIMPNHIHMILILKPIEDHEGDFLTSVSRTSVNDVIRVFKSLTTRLCQSGSNLFQRSYYDHIIRNKNEYNIIRKYIHDNPFTWYYDDLYSIDNDVGE